jgi:hypothetical protein
MDVHKKGESCSFTPFKEEYPRCDVVAYFQKRLSGKINQGYTLIISGSARKGNSQIAITANSISPVIRKAYF